MSLLDRGNQTVLIYPEEETTDDRGNVVRRPAATPVTVLCRVQPSTTEELLVPGQQVEAIYRIITRDAPLGPWALVVWSGRDWDVVGEPRRYTGSSRTAHVDCLIRRREVTA
ncbi:hypothetical protein [Kitasatospora indigofera]|uniref:hypothetical protein n=1 Tax=Kitasatospora indigofera TaxID=67307 RepID=UPI00368C88F2